MLQELFIATYVFVSKAGNRGFFERTYTVGARRTLDLRLEL